MNVLSVKHQAIKTVLHPSSTVTTQPFVDTTATNMIISLDVKDLLCLVILLVVDLSRQVEVNPHLILVLEEELDGSLCSNEVDVDGNTGLEAASDVGGGDAEHDDLCSDGLGLRINGTLDLWALTMSVWFRNARTAAGLYLDGAEAPAQCMLLSCSGLVHNRWVGWVF